MHLERIHLKALVEALVAKDIPEYEQQEIVQPSTAPSGFTEAYSHQAQVYEDWADIGANIAQNASNEMTKQRAIEAAQTPGRNLWPALTESDKMFNQVYKDEEAAVIDYQGKQTLRKMYEDLNKMPNLSGKELLEYENASKRSMQELLSYSNDSMKPGLKRSLQSQYDSYFYNLSNKVNANNQRFLSEQNAAQMQQSVESMDDAWREGRTEAAIESKDNLIKQMYKKSELEDWPLERIVTEEQKIIDRYEQGKLEAEYEKTPEADKPKFIATVRDKLPKDMSPTHQDRVVAGVQQFANQYDSAAHGLQQINYTNLLSKLNDNKLTQQDIDTAINENQLNAKQIADLNFKMTSRNKEANKVNELMLSMSGDFDNAGEMAKYTDKEKNSVFTNLVSLQQAQIEQQTGKPYKATLIDEASIAQGIKSTIPAFNKKLTQAAKFGNAEQATEALRALNMLNQNNPSAVSGIDKDTKAMLYTFQDLQRSTTADAEESLKTARGDINVDENTKQSRLDNWKEYRKNAPQLQTTPALLNHIASNLGAKSGIIFKSPHPELMPTGLDVVYERLMNATVPMTGDVARAEKIVFEEMGKVYQPTNINQRNEIMAFPPEQVLGSAQFANEDKLRAVKDFVDINHELKAKSGFTFNNVSIEGDPKPGEDIYVNVNGKKRKLIVQSDIETQYSIDTMPSWQLNYLDETGIPMPIMDMAGGGVARWRPDLSKRKTKEDIEVEQLAKAEKKLERTKFERAQRAKVFLEGD